MLLVGFSLYVAFKITLGSIIANYFNSSFPLKRQFTQNKQRSIYVVFIIIALIFNGTATVIASSFSAHKAIQYASGDAMMICTGNTLKWISQSAFFETGNVVEIDPPKDAPDNIEQTDCSYSFLSEQFTDELTIPKLEGPSLAYYHKAAAIAQRPYTSFQYQTSQSRAPPIS